ncbi:MAG: putative acetolactate synthase large subunit [Frankiales bacterium]|nr:putative acetolactate synthase large subunit [Frankiales bacterium]
MKVYEGLAAGFLAEGVDCVFGLMGDANLKWWSAMAGGGATMLSARHETALVAMADAYAQATGRVGVAAVTCGPALVHAATPLIAAARARTPLVLFAGDTASATLGNPQDIDQRKVADLCEAGFVQLRGPGTVAEDVRAAFFRARTERRPIVLNAPMDLVGAELSGPWWYAPASGLCVPQRGEPDEQTCATVVDLIASARRPVVVAGRGAMASGARESVLELGRLTGALLATTMPAKGWLDEDEFAVGLTGPLASAVGRDLLAEADLVIAVGASLDRYSTTDGAGAYLGARVVSITDAPALQGSCRAPDVFLVGDADTCVRRLLTRLAARGVASEGFRTPETRTRIASSVEAEVPAVDGAGGLDPRTVMRALEDVLGDDDSVVVGVGHFLSFAAMHLRRPSGGHFSWTHYFGAIGYALPIGIGVAVGQPHRRVVVIEGDGSLMMSLPELESAVRMGLDILVVVINDQALGAEMHKLRAEGLDPAQAHLPTPDFGAVARVLGGRGDLVTDAAGLRAALDLHRSGERGLHVIDARTDRDAMSEMYHQMHFGRPHRAPHQRLEPAAALSAGEPARP